MGEVKRQAAAVEGVASANRALSVLTCFRRGDDRLSLAEIARRTVASSKHDPSIDRFDRRGVPD